MTTPSGLKSWVLELATLVFAAGLAAAEVAPPDVSPDPTPDGAPAPASPAKEAKSQQPWDELKAGQLPGPRIEFDAEVYEFGQVKQGESVAHSFKFKNVGTKPLLLASAKSSCGCTVPSWSKEPIAPGGSGEIAILYTTVGKSGNIPRMVTVTTNDPNRNTVMLEVRGEILVPDAGAIQVMPMRLDFGMVNSADKIGLELMIRNAGSQPLTIDEVIGSSPELSASIASATKVHPKGETRVGVTLQIQPETRGGYFARSITIRSDDPVKPTLEIPVTGYIRTRLGARLLTVGGDIDVGAVGSTGQALLQIPVMNTGDSPLVVERVEVSGTAVQVDRVANLTVAPGSSASLQLRALPKLQKGAFEDRVLIFWNDGRSDRMLPSQTLKVVGCVTADSGVATPQGNSNK